MPRQRIRYDVPADAVAFEGFSIAAPSEPTAQRVVREVLGKGWSVWRVGRESNEFHALPPKRHRVTPALAWARTATLRARREVEFADPLFRMPGLEPPAPRGAPRRGRGVRRSGSGGESHLPCSADPMWSLRACRVEQAWALQPSRPEGRRFGEGIVVAHPDTGYTDHPQFAGDGRVRVADGYDFYRQDGDPRDELEPPHASHGTSTGSVIMSERDPAGALEAVHGVAPRAGLVPLRVTNSVVLFSFRTLASALAYAADHGWHVASISLGGAWSSDSLLRALRYATERGVIVVAAAGNHWPWVVYPAKYEETVAVCASNCRGAIWSGASAGDDVDVSAPGESVWRARTDAEGDYHIARSSGSSYASATVAGTAALWLAFHGRDWLIARYGAPRIAAVFKEVLMAHGVATPRGWDTSRHGAGILDAERLLAAPLPDAPRAAGLRGLRAARRQDPADSLGRYAPGRGPVALRRALARMLHASERELPAVLDAHADELAFHLAINPALRSRLAGPGRARRAAGRLSLALASPALRRCLAPR